MDVGEWEARADEREVVKRRNKGQMRGRTRGRRPKNRRRKKERGV